MRKKTWNSEIGIALLVFLAYLALQGKTEELKILTTPFVAFAGVAFGWKQPILESFISRKS